MKCGAYESVITPALGLRIPGYFVERIADGILDELYAKAVVFDNGDKVVGFLALDILHVRADMVKRIRDRFTEFTGVSSENIMVSGTHTHTGQAVEENDEFGMPDETWIDITCKKAADALIMAYNNRVDCTIGFGKGEEKELSFNRRFWQKDGVVRTWPGIKNPDNVRPAAGVDYDIFVAKILDLDERPIAVITNFANHLDLIGGTKYSADYPGVLSKCIKKSLGDKVVSLFLNGCCGDVTHIDYTGEHTFDSEHYIYSGTVLAHDVLKVYTSLKTKEVDYLDGESAVLKIDRRQPSKEMYENSKKVLDEYNSADKKSADKGSDEDYEKPTTGDADLMEMSYHKCNVNLYENPILSENCEVQAIRIGDAVFSGMPGEMFAEIGMDLKEKSQFDINFNVELANGCYGYIATEKAFPEGGYEVTLDRYVNLSEKAGTMMEDKLLEIHTDFYNRKKI